MKTVTLDKRFSSCSNSKTNELTGLGWRVDVEECNDSGSNMANQLDHKQISLELYIWEKSWLFDVIDINLSFSCSIQLSILFLTTFEQLKNLLNRQNRGSILNFVEFIFKNFWIRVHYSSFRKWEMFGKIPRIRFALLSIGKFCTNHISKKIFQISFQIVAYLYTIRSSVFLQDVERLIWGGNEWSYTFLDD